MRAARTTLLAFLEQDATYVAYLSGSMGDVARRLRFHANTAALAQHVDVCRFTDAIPHLRYLHGMYASRLRDLSVMDTAVTEWSERLVQIVSDMLRVIRYPYGQLFCRSEAIHAAVDTALKAKSDNGEQEQQACDAATLAILRSLAQDFDNKSSSLVIRPLQQFHAVVEFVEQLSADVAADHATAVRLRQIAQETRQYIDAVQVEARNEQELIALQSQIVPGEGSSPLDLATEKLLLHGEVSVVAVNDSLSAAKKSFSDRLEKRYAHCFESGKLVYSKHEVDERDGPSADRFAIQGCIELKQDAFFLEFVPDAVFSSGATKGCFALISSNESVVFGFEDSILGQSWGQAVRSMLSQNETKNVVLRSQRTFEDMKIPQHVVKQLKYKKKSFAVFPSFHDDDLPGIFWMETGPGKWEIVELMFYEHWLLIFTMKGWKQHALARCVDTQDSSIDVSDQRSGEHDWCLVISMGHEAKDEVRLISKRRSRIDFWYDQISKAVATAKKAKADKQIEEQQTPAKSVGSEQQLFVKARAKKNRKHAEAVSGETPASDVVAVAEKPAEGPATATKATRKRKTDEVEQQNSDKSSTSGVEKPADAEKKKGVTPAKRKKAVSRTDSFVQVAQEALDGDGDTAPSAESKPKRSRKEPAKKLGEASIPVMQSSAIKTPKRRWLKLKSEDPDDAILLDTDPSQDTSIEEATSNAVVPGSGSQTTKDGIRVILTGIEPTPAIRKKIKAIANAMYEDDIEKATHVIAPKNQLKRTVKLLCGISRCQHILGMKWLDESARVGAALNEADYCLKDTNAQQKWHFDLHKTMYEFTPEQRRQLFVGHTVFITNHKSVLPPVKDLVKIVECAGGKAEVKGSAGPSDLVITSEAALGVVSVQKSLVSANPQRIYSPELILSSILQQHIDFEQNHLVVSPSSSEKR
uniref:BRCT domain-containing protein n=1 Tax=Globisporangium ultimum (strain ATCC 200006 / CBS 805.95 / DAOM BR144) TaxID=431595 RepID=K3WG72_GLOUD